MKNKKDKIDLKRTKNKLAIILVIVFSAFSISQAAKTSHFNNPLNFELNLNYISHANLQNEINCLAELFNPDMVNNFKEKYLHKKVVDTFYMLGIYIETLKKAADNYYKKTNTLPEQHFLRKNFFSVVLFYGNHSQTHQIQEPTNILCDNLQRLQKILLIYFIAALIHYYVTNQINGLYKSYQIYTESVYNLTCLSNILKYTANIKLNIKIPTPENQQIQQKIHSYLYLTIPALNQPKTLTNFIFKANNFITLIKEGLTLLINEGEPPTDGMGNFIETLYQVFHYNLNLNAEERKLLKAKIIKTDPNLIPLIFTICLPPPPTLKNS